jgi:hypothetical protein
MDKTTQQIVYHDGAIIGQSGYKTTHTNKHEALQPEGPAERRSGKPIQVLSV